MSDAERTIRNSRTLVILVSTFLAAAVCGCGSNRPDVVRASGRVLVDGKPLTYGMVRFVPSDGRLAAGRLDKEGRFTLTTFEDNDGVLAGTHRVTINAGEWLNHAQRRWHAPKKYSKLQSSDLSVTIDEPTDDLVIELTWAGRKPFTEHSGSKGEVEE